jgi:hypothetical protein
VLASRGMEMETVSVPSHAATAHQTRSPTRSRVRVEHIDQVSTIELALDSRDGGKDKWLYSRALHVAPSDCMAAVRKPFVDELTPIAEYMAKEMNRNAAGEDCVRMAKLNAVSSEACIEEYRRASWWQRMVGLSPQECIDMEMSSGAAALMIWAGKVRQDGDWDHKPKIRKTFVSPTTKNGAWHAYGGTAYYYDVWSNVHYGYVGIAAGFSESALLDGAGLEQIGSNLLRGRWPKGTDGVKGLRRFDDVSDRVSIRLGIDLFRVSPRLLAPHQLRWAVLTARGLATKGAQDP